MIDAVVPCIALLDTRQKVNASERSQLYLYGNMAKNVDVLPPLRSATKAIAHVNTQLMGGFRVARDTVLGSQGPNYWHRYSVAFTLDAVTLGDGIVHVCTLMNLACGRQSVQGKCKRVSWNIMQHTAVLLVAKHVVARICMVWLLV